MKLETILEVYGTNDYYEQLTGKIYRLSVLKDNENVMVDIPVTIDNIIVEFVKVKNPNV